MPPQRTGINRFRTTTLLFRFGSPILQPVISATADRTRVRVGETVTIRGNLAPLSQSRTVARFSVLAASSPTVLVAAR